MENLISPKELTKRMNIAMSTLYLRMQEPDFPPKIKIGNSTRFRASEIEEYLKANTENKQPEKA